MIFHDYVGLKTVLFIIIIFVDVVGVVVDFDVIIIIFLNKCPWL